MYYWREVPLLPCWLLLYPFIEAAGMTACDSDMTLEAVRGEGLGDTILLIYFEWTADWITLGPGKPALTILNFKVYPAGYGTFPVPLIYCILLTLKFY